MNKVSVGFALIAVLAISGLGVYFTISTWPASSAPVGCDQVAFKVPHPTDTIDVSARVSVECPRGWEPSRL